MNNLKINEIEITKNLTDSIAKKLQLFEKLLQSISDSYNSLCFASSMGAEDMVILDIINNSKSKVAIFTLDTGRLHQETYNLISLVNQKYSNKVKVFFPDAQEVKDYVEHKGINGFYDSYDARKECCRIRKIEPLKNALIGHDAWITGLRSEQSITRKENNIIEKDDLFKIDKISPLLDWSEEEIWGYIKSNEVPYNLLHNQFFPSIGCEPCTRAVAKGEDIRSGRWWWENPDSKECGLHQKIKKG